VKTPFQRSPIPAGGRSHIHTPVGASSAATPDVRRTRHRRIRPPAKPGQMFDTLLLGPKLHHKLSQPSIDPRLIDWAMLPEASLRSRTFHEPVLPGEGYDQDMYYIGIILRRLPSNAAVTSIRSSLRAEISAFAGAESLSGSALRNLMVTPRAAAIPRYSHSLGEPSVAAPSQLMSTQRASFAADPIPAKRFNISGSGPLIPPPNLVPLNARRRLEIRILCSLVSVREARNFANSSLAWAAERRLQRRVQFALAAPSLAISASALARSVASHWRTVSRWQNILCRSHRD